MSCPSDTDRPPSTGATSTRMSQSYALLVQHSTAYTLLGWLTTLPSLYSNAQYPVFAQPLAESNGAPHLTSDNQASIQSLTCDALPRDIRKATVGPWLLVCALCILGFRLQLVRMQHLIERVTVGWSHQVSGCTFRVLVPK